MLQFDDAVTFVDQIIKKAVLMRASDIHFEQNGDGLRVRFRIDGKLFDVENVNKKNSAKIISRLKIMLGTDIGQTRLPQDGKIHITINNQYIDIRGSIIPTIYGEKIVLRLLNKNQTMLVLSELGFLDEQLKIYKKALNHPYGLILVTGPTGSGKTTTLYSTINEINTAEKNIITIEDPVEYEIQGANQIQVNYKIGLDFNKGLRAILRQDPDIIMIGEIRDSETAKIAVQAAMTGHLVFSTLHTNNAASAVERLVDMGVEPYFVSSALICVIAQRLVRRLCQKCEDCNYSGYKGRIGIFEVIYFDEKLKSIVKTSPQAKVIEKNSSIITMKEAGLKLVQRGIISEEDLIATTCFDESIF